MNRAVGIDIPFVFAFVNAIMVVSVLVDVVVVVVVGRTFPVGSDIAVIVGDGGLPAGVCEPLWFGELGADCDCECGPIAVGVAFKLNRDVAMTVFDSSGMDGLDPTVVSSIMMTGVVEIPSNSLLFVVLILNDAIFYALMYAL